jgi:hypothetical protein
MTLIHDLAERLRDLHNSAIIYGWNSNCLALVEDGCPCADAVLIRKALPPALVMTSQDDEPPETDCLG